jgi:hypothetical protein
LLGEDHPVIRDCASYLAAIDAREGSGADAQTRLAALVDLRRRRAEPGLALTRQLQAASLTTQGAH